MRRCESISTIECFAPGADGRLFRSEKGSIIRLAHIEGMAQGSVVRIPLLPLTEGYYFTADNADRVAGCYREWLVWTRRHGLVLGRHHSRKVPGRMVVGTERQDEGEFFRACITSAQFR